MQYHRHSNTNFWNNKLFSGFGSVLLLLYMIEFCDSSVMCILYFKKWNDNHFWYMKIYLCNNIQQWPLLPRDHNVTGENDEKQQIIQASNVMCYNYIVFWNS